MGKKQRIGGYYLLDLGGVDLDDYVDVETGIDVGTKVYNYLVKTSKRIVLSNFYIFGVKQPDLIVNGFIGDDTVISFERIGALYDLELYNTGKLIVSNTPSILSEKEIGQMAVEKSINNKYPSLSSLERTINDIVTDNAGANQLEVGSTTLTDATKVQEVKNLIESWIKRGFIKYSDETITLSLVVSNVDYLKAIFSCINLDEDGTLDSENIIIINLDYTSRALSITSKYL